MRILYLVNQERKILYQQFIQQYENLNVNDWIIYTN